MQLNSQRRLGLILGLVLGLGFSLSSNLINQLFLPDLPLFVPWPGTVGLIILNTLMLGILGLLAAWPEESLPGIIASALVGSLISSIWIIINESGDRASVLIALFLVFLPRVFFYLPFSWLIRWLISRLEDSSHRKVAPSRRLFMIVIAFGAAVFVGTLSRFPQEVRQSLVRMDDLLQEGMQASSRDELPRPLQSVEGFVANARGPYTYTIGSDPDVLPVQRPVVDYGELEPFIIVRFDNGFRFGCVFSPPYVVPACIDY